MNDLPIELVKIIMQKDPKVYIILAQTCKKYRQQINREDYYTHLLHLQLGKIANHIYENYSTCLYFQDGSVQIHKYLIHDAVYDWFNYYKDDIKDRIKNNEEIDIYPTTGYDDKIITYGLLNCSNRSLFHGVDYHSHWNLWGSDDFEPDAYCSIYNIFDEFDDLYLASTLPSS